MLSNSSVQQALHDATNLLQVVIFQREDLPIRDRDEAVEDLTVRVQNIGKINPNGSGKKKWRAALLELAAYAIFAAVSDD